ncbi:MAG: helix-turn-helix domain-containing protein [Puniceicoccales bacterium]
MDEQILSILHAEREYVSSLSYQWDNRKRAKRPIACVVQRTRTGCPFIEDDFQRFLVPAGSAMLFYHGDNTNYGLSPEYPEPFESDWIVISGEQALPLFESLIAMVGRVVAMPEDSEAARLLDIIVSRYGQEGYGDRFRESALAYEFLMTCCRLSGPGRPTGDPIWQAREYILSHYQQPFSQQELADRIGLSREHLARRFRENYGISPGRFCTDLRMARARDLLRVSQTSIEQVALQCGYVDANSFSRAVRRAYGVSPRELR